MGPLFPGSDAPNLFRGLGRCCSLKEDCDINGGSVEAWGGGVLGGVWIRAGLARGSTVGVGAVDRLSLLLPIASELIAAQMGSEHLKRIHRHGASKKRQSLSFLAHS
ncbi:unnamed protein product [Arctogadus glacialis]